jgi:hypothetical protein
LNPVRRKIAQIFAIAQNGTLLCVQGVRGASYIGIIQEKKIAVASTGFNGFVSFDE